MFYASVASPYPFKDLARGFGWTGMGKKKGKEERETNQWAWLTRERGKCAEKGSRPG